MGMFLEALKRDDVKAAIAEGSIKLVDKTVKVSAKSLKSAGINADTVKAAGLSVDKDGDIVFPVQVPEAQNGKGMAILCGGKIEPATAKPEGKDDRTDAQKATGVCDVFNYAVDLDVRQDVRQNLIMAKLESPDKAIAKAVAALEALGMDRDSAVKAAIAGAVASGRVSADYTFAG
jgi:hypothetical protein